MQMIAVFHTSILQHLKRSVRDYRTALPESFRYNRVLNDVREGGGAFGKMEKAKEDEFFYKKTKQDIEKMKLTKEQKLKLVKDHIDKHKGDVRHYEAILQELSKDLEKFKGKK